MEKLKRVTGARSPLLPDLRRLYDGRSTADRVRFSSPRYSFSHLIFVIARSRPKHNALPR